MKFTIETSALASALNIASVAMDGRISLPILGNVKIEATKTGIILSTTNLDLHVIQQLPATVVTVGATSAPFVLLQKLVSRLHSTQTDIEADAKTLRLRCGDVNAILEVLPAEEFPPSHQQNRDNAVACDAKDILTPFAKLVHAISKDSTQYTLMGVNVSPHNGGNAFVATNRRRLAVFTGATLTSENVIIPDVFVRAILKIDPTGEVRVTIADGIIALVTPNLDVSCRLIEGQYPRWEQVIPKNGNHLFACDRKELAEALRTCAIFSDRETRALHMSGKGKEILISKDETIKALVLGSELAGQPKITMRFNCDYMLDVLSVLDESNVTVRCSDSSSAMVVEEGQFKAIVMPMAQ